MFQISLNGTWLMTGAGYDCSGTIPGSVYSFLLDNQLIEDPYYRQNEWEIAAISDNEFEFTKAFDFTPTGDTVLLHCDGPDTLCDIYINGTHVAATDNMHRTYEFDVTSLLLAGENIITVACHPVRELALQRNNENPLCLLRENGTMGFGYIRKAHCMSGWDWGPRFPDAGIWRDIKLLVLDSARITDFHILQRHEGGKVFVTPMVTIDSDCTLLAHPVGIGTASAEQLTAANAAPAACAVECTKNGSFQITVTIQTPDGAAFTLPANQESEIENPKLWWPNGLGEQPLYTLTAALVQDGKEVDSQSKRIGLRTLKLIREKDKYGESFCHEVNGIRFFAMGADYIPEDNILARITPDRTRWLLQQCKNCNFNAIRVWGGGFYPHDYFFDICDELGLVVFEDMMFACTLIWLDDAFKETITAEFRDNLKRMRHHACLALISGNNEIEACFGPDNAVYTEELGKMYLEVFEDILPQIMEEVCPYIPYIPSSPTSCGHFIDPNNQNYGDCHYWEVWHGDLPFTEYRNLFFRYLSEFGFQSFPCEKTVNAFTLPEERNIFSRVMEMHQRNGTANGKIMNYMAQTFLYPTNFGTLLYASQLLQAEAIRYGVEHFRRHRGRCMGTLYWQLNDIWPVASWASIDYYNRYKALQYVAKRFYSPVLISCKETGEKETRPVVHWEYPLFDYETKAQLCVTNDTLSEINGTAVWALRDSTGTILKEGRTEMTIPALSAVWLEEMDFHKTDVEHTYMSFAFEVNGQVLSEGTVLFTAPKHFLFRNPNLRYELNGDEITIYADAYARYVEIDSPDSDFILSDNYFDMNAGSKTVKILEGTPGTIALRSVYDIK